MAETKKSVEPGTLPDLRQEATERHPADAPCGARVQVPLLSQIQEPKAQAGGFWEADINAHALVKF